MTLQTTESPNAQAKPPADNATPDVPIEPPIRLLLIAAVASFRYGGEAILPLHYFLQLRAREVPVWMITNARSRQELSQKLSAEDMARIYFVPDNTIHRALATVAEYLPSGMATFSLRQILEIVDQWRSRRLAKKLIPQLQIDLVHQPIPASPKHVSLIHGLGVPVVMGPMNGGISFPHGFHRRENPLDRLFITIGRAMAGIANRLLPGKLKAATLLVANQRSRDALPARVTGKVEIMVENGVDLSLYRSALRSLPATPQKDSDPVRVAFVGRLVSLKGVDLLLRALVIARQHANIHVDVIGDGPCRHDLEKLSAELSLQHFVNFRGWLAHADCAAALAKSDVFVLPSFRESGGAAVLEAMAMRLPVIAANWGGPADYIDPSCGLLIDVDGADSFITNLAAALVKLARSPELRISMGQAGYEKVRREYDWEGKAGRMLTIYRETLTRAGKKPSSAQSQALPISSTAASHETVAAS